MQQWNLYQLGSLPRPRRGVIRAEAGRRANQALANGWPIATGVIEGARRHLIADRLGIGGARWGL